MARSAYFVAGLLAVLTSCRSSEPLLSRRPPEGLRMIQPVVAVTDFENLSNFSGQWSLGSGMADLLTALLLDSGRVIVLERRHLDTVVGEILRQGTDLFREEGRVVRGRLKNARYLVRGSITDFTETGGASAGGGSSWLRLFGRGSRARVSIVMHISDVESGEIIASVRAARSVSAGGAGGDARYKNVSFGGEAFFRTPLGRATESALRDAVHRILKELPPVAWDPRVAEAGEEYVVLNGGANARLRVGDRFVVREEGREITDPVSGNLLESVPGPVVGRLQVVEVLPVSAHATLLEGRAQRGDRLEFGR
ncbi:MAG TPA: CsgG/HfaB family protein [Kiritimatiellia bacterium]|nr:CsgG/HfaB family protein [Kiritimatiellia bacterium]HSA17142.1 CsgG/HfaB family protein [Kiritimatiellia bacterium]